LIVIIKKLGVVGVMDVVGVDGVMDMHTCYLLGEPVVQSSLEVPSFRGKHASLTVREQAEAAEAAGPRVCVALSTEALLLNGYRMTRQAMPMQVQVDTTWKLVKEGHGTIVVGTTAVDQAFHAIAYAVVSREDTIGHELVFAQIRDAVQAVVSKYGDEWKYSSSDPTWSFRTFFDGTFFALELSSRHGGYALSFP
jgi:hypothetical protein